MTPKLEEVPAEIPAAPQVDIFVQMGRQMNQYFTSPNWPALEEQTLPIAHVMRGDGLWERRINDVGVFIAQKAQFTVPGFPKENNTEGFALNHGPIPNELLQEILYFFKAICDDSKDEVYMQIFWSLEDQIVDGKHIPAGVYFNHCPTQIVSGASVEFERNVELEEKNTLVLEIHSHNTMSANFSSVDDRDEKRDRLFGVIGCLDRMTPEMKFSFVCGGKRVIIKKDDIFTEPLGQPFPTEWRGNVSKRATVVTGPHGYQAGNYGSGYNQASQGAWKTQESPGPTRTWSNAHQYDGQIERPATVSGFTAQTKSEIKEEVARAAEAALDATLKARDFMKDSSDSRVATSVSAEIVSRPLPSTIVRPAAVKLERVEPEVSTLRPFFRQETTVADQDDEVDAGMAAWQKQRELDSWDKALDSKSQEIKMQFLNQKFLDQEMTDDNKRALFQDLMAYLEPADIGLLAETMVDMGHEESLMDALQGTIDPDNSTERTVTVGN